MKSSNKILGVLTNWYFNQSSLMNQWVKQMDGRANVPKTRSFFVIPKAFASSPCTSRRRPRARTPPGPPGLDHRPRGETRPRRPNWRRNWRDARTLDRPTKKRVSAKTSAMKPSEKNTFPHFWFTLFFSHVSSVNRYKNGLPKKAFLGEL